MWNAKEEKKVRSMQMEAKKEGKEVKEKYTLMNRRRQCLNIIPFFSFLLHRSIEHDPLFSLFYLLLFVHPSLSRIPG